MGSGVSGWSTRVGSGASAGSTAPNAEPRRQAREACPAALRCRVLQSVPLGSTPGGRKLRNRRLESGCFPPQTEGSFVISELRMWNRNHEQAPPPSRGSH